MKKRIGIILLLSLLIVSSGYAQLSSAISFFDYNYCGTGQTVSWRGTCHTSDNPTGGYHDAGDHVKFGLPMSFAITMLCWADYEYGISAGSQIGRGISYFEDCASGTFTYQVGDPGADHAYWGPPEEDPNSRPSASSNQASCVIAGTAAALAAAAVTGNGGNISLAESLYSTAESTMSDSGYTAANGFYDSWSEFYDELAWAAIWIYLATNDSSYLTKAETYAGQMKTDWVWTHCWDDKGYGVYLMLARITGSSTYISQLESWLDWWMPGGGITYTGGGLPYLDTWGALRYASATAFLAKVWSESPNCTSSKTSTYSNFADDVVDYILGNNPANLTYVIGFGNNWPQYPHHRAACPSFTAGPCLFQLTGALVGGPDSSDNYIDDINQYQYTEVAIDYNACLVAALAATGSTGMVPSPTAVPPSCDSVPTWDADTIYDTAGTQVVYNNKLYENKYYSQNQNPEENSGPYDVWTYLGPCTSGTTAAPTATPVVTTEPAATPVETPAPTPTPVVGVLLGDVNSDDSIDIVDALLVAQCYVGLTSCADPSMADVNCDGTIDIVDALLIAQYYVGLISQFC